MNLEEAKANIGKEVVYIGKNKTMAKDFNGKKLIIIYSTKIAESNVVVKVVCDELRFLSVPPQDLKLKEQPMQNYKIKVTPETSAEVQELFFELGYGWNSGNNIPKYKNNRYIHTISKNIIVTNCEEVYTELNATEITLPQLRDIVVLKRNDVSDATHIHKDNHKEKYYVGCYVYIWTGSYFTKAILGKYEVNKHLVPISNFTQMTWQDALRAVADGKDVEAEGFNSIKEWLELNIGTAKKFRLKPKTIHIDDGDYTKEELLKIVGEME